MKLRPYAFLAFLTVLCTISVPLTAQTFKTLANFDLTNGGSAQAGLVQGLDGGLYGETSVGGTFGWGTAYEVSHHGALTVLHNFDYSDGFNPYGNLLLATDGKFYGMTTSGGDSQVCPLGCGTVFEVTSQGALTTLHFFCSEAPTSEPCIDGGNPWGSLVEGSDGNFYGTATGGEIDNGVVFKISPQGRFTLLHSFLALEGGVAPEAGLTQGNDGNFYGTTYGGGTYGDGTIFRITSSGVLTTLYNFCYSGCKGESVGESPSTPLVKANDGNFYGTTSSGGDLDCYPPVGCGTIFRFSSDGAVTAIHTFEGTDGYGSGTILLQATDGDLYGASPSGGSEGCMAGCGTLFKSTTSGTFTTLHFFDSTDGANPDAGLFQATDGSFYGTTHGGGTDSQGTVFTLDVGLNPFVAFVRSYGKVGQTCGILGQGFTGATGVSFNGTAASFTVVSDTFIRATVPTGASTGYVIVSAPNSLLTSNVTFRVIP